MKSRGCFCVGLLMLISALRVSDAQTTSAAPEQASHAGKESEAQAKAGRDALFAETARQKLSESRELMTHATAPHEIVKHALDAIYWLEECAKYQVPLELPAITNTQIASEAIAKCGDFAKAFPEYELATNSNLAHGYFKLRWLAVLASSDEQQRLQASLSLRDDAHSVLLQIEGRRQPWATDEERTEYAALLQKMSDKVASSARIGLPLDDLDNDLLASRVLVCSQAFEQCIPEHATRGTGHVFSVLAGVATGTLLPGRFSDAQRERILDSLLAEPADDRETVLVIYRLLFGRSNLSEDAAKLKRSQRVARLWQEMLAIEAKEQKASPSAERLDLLDEQTNRSVPEDVLFWLWLQEAKTEIGEQLVRRYPAKSAGILTELERRKK
jgi:hypothetical protein